MRPPQRCNPFRAPRCALSPSREKVPRRGMRGACRAGPSPACHSIERTRDAFASRYGRHPLPQRGEGSRAGAACRTSPHGRRVRAQASRLPPGVMGSEPQDTGALQRGTNPRSPKIPPPAKHLTGLGFPPCRHHQRRKLVPTGRAGGILARPSVLTRHLPVVRTMGGRAVPLGARPHQPSLKGVAGTAAPSVLQGATAPEAAVARGASLGGREEPAGGVTRPAGPGRGGQKPISPANGRKPQGASPGCRPERRDRRRWTRRPLLVLPPRTRGPEPAGFGDPKSGPAATRGHGGIRPQRLPALHPSCLRQGPGTDGSKPGRFRRGNGEACADAG